ncbi:MAG TPA: carboxypeptidase-like regulatory domain-containing protein, partial [Candidatus Acidoferrum sp.]|nr:carboxypeptidase-like regulatory domain-containing protein [Candidatus Acidoferrum sp.]
MRAAVLILLTAPILLNAQQGCALGGIVVNSTTKEPVARAIVYARAQPVMGQAGAGQRPTGASATTDASGRFALAGLPPGRYNVTAERKGFITGNYGARRPGRDGLPLTLEAGKDIQDLILPIAPHGVIAGRVLDEEGDPAAGIPVQISTIGYQNGRKQFMRLTSASTNDLGEYRAYGLAPGKYYVSAIGATSIFASTTTTQKPPDEEYVPVYYPRAIDPAAAVPLTIT